MRIDRRHSRILERLSREECNDWIETVEAIGLDPKFFFEDSDWTGTDFSMSDMRGVSFRGAVLDHAIFRAGDFTARVRQLARSAENVREVFGFIKSSFFRFEVYDEVQACASERGNALIIGRAGTGKTTLMEAVADQINVPEEYKLRLLGQNIDMGLRDFSGRFDDKRFWRAWRAQSLDSDRLPTWIHRKMSKVFEEQQPGIIVVDDIDLAPRWQVALLSRLSRRFRVPFLATASDGWDMLPVCERARGQQEVHTFRVGVPSTNDIGAMLSGFSLSERERARWAHELSGRNIQVINEIMSCRGRMSVSEAVQWSFQRQMDRLLERSSGNRRALIVEVLEKLVGGTPPYKVFTPRSLFRGIDASDDDMTSIFEELKSLGFMAQLKGDVRASSTLMRWRRKSAKQLIDFA